MAALAGLRSDGSQFGSALEHFASIAAASDRERLAADYDRLFIGIGQGEIVPFASYYLSGSLHDIALVSLRRDLRRLGLARADGSMEPEDHAATVLEVMGELLARSGARNESAAVEFWQAHLAPWMPLLFRSLRQVADAPFYAALGEAGAAFMAEERLRFATG